MKRKVRAFTLVELLLALSITAILVVLLVNVVAAALNVWGQGRNQIDTYATARQTLGRIADELIGATAAASPRPIEFSENLPALRGSTDPIQTTSENIFFVAPYPNAKPGDLCVLAYRHNNDTHTLERGFIESQTAWKFADPARYQASIYSSGDWQWRTVADGVLEFEIRSYSQSDVDEPPTSTATPVPTWTSTGAPPMTGNTPRRVVIRMKLIDTKTLVRLTAIPVGSTAYTDLITQAAREFTASVTLPPVH